MTVEKDQAFSHFNVQKMVSGLLSEQLKGFCFDSV